MLGRRDGFFSDHLDSERIRAYKGITSYHSSELDVIIQRIMAWTEARLDDRSFRPLGGLQYWHPL